MIRKILLSATASVVILWLVGAYYIKNTLLNSLTNSQDNNIEFTYKDAAIGGFPFSWKITISEPKITLTNQLSVQEFFAKEIKLYFDYELKNLRVNLPSAINYNFNKSGIVHDYSLVSNRIIKARMSFIESLYNIEDNFWEKNYIESIDLKLPQIRVVLNNQDIFHVDNYDFLVLRKITNNIDTSKIKIQADYKSDVNYLEISTGHLLFDIDYEINDKIANNETNLDFDHKVNIGKFIFKFDDASLDISGDLNLSRTKMPYGDLKINLEQYHRIIDFLIPQDFFLPKSSLKKIIAKASVHDLTKSAQKHNNASLDVKFSDQGIIIGTIDLLQINQSK